MELIVTLVFASIGLLFTVLGIIFFFIIDELLMPVIFTILGIIFAVIGIAMLINNRKNKKKQEEIFANGTKYTGIIVEHVSGSGVTLNGMLPIALVVKCTINGIERAEALKIIHQVFASSNYSRNSLAILAFKHFV